MAKRDYVFASESVSEGHPDKVCDRISDVVVDTFLAADPQARVACETLATTNRVVLAGEVRGPDAITKDMLIEAARHAIKDIGYEQEGFHWKHAEIACHLHKQSSDIAQGVDASGNKDEGAGDQGIMFGYACRETPDLMPAPIYYSHAILKSLAEARHSGAAPLLGPDAKSQVSLQYVNGNPVRATSVVVSTQHGESIDQDDVREIADEADTPETSLERATTSEILRACVAKLPPAHREIINLVYYHEKSVEEVGQIIGIPQSTVKTRMFYARKQLADLLKGAGVEGLAA